MKEGAPLRAKAVPGKVRAYGPGLEATGVVAKENIQTYLYVCH